MIVCAFTMSNAMYSTTVTVNKGDTVVTAITDTVQSTAPTLSEAERLIDKYGGKFYDVITGLAQQLQIPAEHVYQVFTDQYFASGLVTLILITFFLLSSLIGLIFSCMAYINGGKKYKEKHEYGDYCETSAGIIQIITMLATGIIFLICIVVVTTDASEALMQVMNPEYYTIKEIMSLVR